MKRWQRASREQKMRKQRCQHDAAKNRDDRPHTPKRLTPEQESAQRKAAFAAIRALFCQVTEPWHSCQRGYCRRHHCCIAEAGPGACLGRHWPLLTPAEQDNAHREVINGGPRRLRPQTHIGMELAPLPAVEFRPWLSGASCRRRRHQLTYSRTTCGSARKFDGVTNTIRLAMTMVPARK